MSAPSGNKNARRAKELRDSLRYTLDNFENSAVEKGQALRAIGSKLVEMALDGNLAAIKEIGDRIEGKPAQTTTIIEEGNRQDLEDYSIDELKKLLSDLRREDSLVNGNKKALKVQKDYDEQSRTTDAGT